MQDFIMRQFWLVCLASVRAKRWKDACDGTQLRRARHGEQVREVPAFHGSEGFPLMPSNIADARSKQRHF